MSAAIHIKAWLVRGVLDTAAHKEAQAFKGAIAKQAKVIGVPTSAQSGAEYVES
jgi:hypothetical protein